ncbi:MAG: DUF3800 domain-containing protein [Acidobacteriota bacterium]|nr:DUF3800 domain-containing protein [Acidobacteriota bacterium]
MVPILPVAADFFPISPRGETDERHEWLKRILEILLPRNGLAAMMEFYMDESNSEDSDRVIVVAGYLFESDQCRLLDDEWKRLVEDEAELPYFHMTDCANGVGKYKILGRTKCDRLARSLIALIKKRMTLQVAFSVQEAEFKTAMGIPPHEHFNWSDVFGGVYSFLAIHCLSIIGDWAKVSRYEGDISYFFEAGNDTQHQIDDTFRVVGKDPLMSQKCHYNSHTFVRKGEVRPIQAADILAWEWMTDWKHQFGMSDLPRRRSLHTLLQMPFRVQHLRDYDLKKALRSSAERILLTPMP